MPPIAHDWAQFCTQWLGWDVNSAAPVAHPGIAGLPVSDITQSPRKYGLHATLKPPFRLSEGTSQDDLAAACADLAAQQPPVHLNGLELARFGRFLALKPVGPTQNLNTFAANCVAGLDAFRAPLSGPEMDRRRSARLSVQQLENLARWGYPHVMETFRFHITLTGRLAKPQLQQAETALSEKLVPLLPRPLNITDLALVGEDGNGQFRMISRYALTGT